LSEEKSTRQLFPDLYDELRRIAHRHLVSESASNTLRTTDLVHEAYLRVAAQKTRFSERPHFLAISATMMRRVLVDRARSRTTTKRGGGWVRIELQEDAALSESRIEDLLEIEEVLTKLEQLDARAASVVEMRFFAGMTEAEIAKVMGFSDRWVRKQWAFAKAWLKRELSSTDRPSQ
jgi:RNA polymerase sigma factor (TIGR02999 family)